METNTELVPLLVVRDAAAAIDFYVRALGASVVARYEHGPTRHVSHADLRVANVTFALTEEARAWNSDAPPSLGGSPVVLQLVLSDAASVLSSLLAAGATLVFPMQEFLGERMARVRDPFGHLWLLRQRLVELSADEIQTQRDALFAAVAQHGRSPETAPPGEASDRMPGSAPKVHLVVGPVGAGKSTFAFRFAREHGAVRFALDEWMTALFRPDRPSDGVVAWYVERAARAVERIGTVALEVLERGTPVVLELGLLKRAERERFYERIAESGFDVTVHVLDAPRDVRRARVNERNRTRGDTFSMVVPPDVFERASDLWEAPDGEECNGRDVRFVTT